MKNKHKLYLPIVVVLAMLAAWLMLAETAKAVREIGNIKPMIVSSQKFEDDDTEAAVPQTYVTTPLAGSTITTPVKVDGSAPGTWFFEATLVVKVVDANGVVLGQGPATATADWMTTSLVPFEAVIPFIGKTASTGFIVIEADNPSGKPNPPTYKIPVTFGAETAADPACTSTIAGVCTPGVTEKSSS